MGKKEDLKVSRKTLQLKEIIIDQGLIKKDHLEDRKTWNKFIIFLEEIYQKVPMVEKTILIKGESHQEKDKEEVRAHLEIMIEKRMVEVV